MRTSNAPVIERTEVKLLISGIDNDRKPRQLYADRLAVMNDEQLSAEMEKKIWLSAFVANNPRSDYHWHCDATYSEGERRSKPELYIRAHAKVSRQ